MNNLLNYFDLHRGEENKKEVLSDVVANVSFRGANLWILACAIVIASIGLNVNSTAVIIGAMLISPLMVPIVGAGFALGTYNFPLLKKSLKNLFIATSVSLAVASLYFLITPFKETQSELIARTSPNIYDVLIAFFGGLVGVIAITRVEKGNPIPGVAIATALMPPLCTAGYGIAIWKMSYFFGAIYLYTINCFFICIATFFIVKYLKYPLAKNIDESQEKKVKFGISTLIFLLIIPSFYFAYKLYNEKKFSQHVTEYIDNELTQKGYTVIYKKTDLSTNPKKIELACLEKLNDNDEKVLNDKMKYYQIENSKLKIRRDTVDLKNDILNELGRKQIADNETETLAKKLQNELLNYKFDNAHLLAESKVLFPSIHNLSMAKHSFNEGTDSMQIVGVMLYQSPSELDSMDATKLKQWLLTKLELKDIVLVHQ
ncbi:MAG: DUF389 domain-containing protein [Bacteroidetes bacterium]|nr:DUF389 domain-containing protein [Bacteroidota bacterium]